MWRVVHGVALVYMLVLVAMLAQDKSHARATLAVFFPDIRYLPPGRASCVEADAGCALTLKALTDQILEPWFLAHILGWWGKMCLFRDWGVCWFLSIGFEVLELSLGHVIPQFQECWWDSLIVDFFLANFLGMVAGWWTLKWINAGIFDWGGRLRRKTAAERLLRQFSPVEWSRYHWRVFSSFKRFAQLWVLIIITLAMELNAFFLLNSLGLPRDSGFNKARLWLVFALALPAAAEYYDFIDNPKTHRLGQNAWLMVALMNVEIAVWVKFTTLAMEDFIPPPDLAWPWSICISGFLLWTLLFFSTTKKPSDKPQQLPPPRPDEAYTNKAIIYNLLLDFLFLFSFLPLIWLSKKWA